MRIAILFLFLALSGCGVSSTWQALRENSAGVAALKAQNPGGASEHFITGLAGAPFEPVLHLNLGLSLDQQKKPDDAVKSYVVAEAMARNDVEKFIARFNLGEAYGRAKKIDEALMWYQRALEIKPDSLETKVNIELLINQQGKGGQDQQQDGQGQGDQKQDSKDQNKDNKDDKDKKDSDKKEYGQTPKYQPRPFKGELNESEVKKILGEIRQQEQKIRAEFNRKEVKERPRDKDW